MSKYESKNEEWLKSQCNRYVNGFCSTLACMKRGGYNRKTHIPCENGSNKNWDLATCEPHETLLEIEQLKEDIYNLERQISDYCFTDKEL